MGSTFGDYDADGDLDWFVTSIFDSNSTCDTEGCNWGHTGNRLYRNDGGRVFTDATDAAGVRDGGWGWGTVFFDYDNDGDLDLVMTNGVDFSGSQVEDAYNADPLRFWENDGEGHMTEIAGMIGLTDTQSGKGLLVFDYDDDGDLDLFIVNNAGQPRLYENRGGNRRGWLRVEAHGVDSNSEALGARIWLIDHSGKHPQTREVGTASHFLGQSERTVHFGLGPRQGPRPTVVLKWPGGHVQVIKRVPRNGTLVAIEATPRCGLIGIEPIAVFLVARRRLRIQSRLDFA
jgi:hypothetical protein